MLGGRQRSRNVFEIRWRVRRPVPRKRRTQLDRIVLFWIDPQQLQAALPQAEVRTARRAA
jgi:hypothetical protein